MKIKTGHVYLVESELGFYKIGRTSKLRERMNLFEIKLPFNIKLIHSIPSDDIVWAETLLHEQYATKHINGEWFRLSSEDIDYICRIAVMNRRGTWVRRSTPLDDSSCVDAHGTDP
jgi:hypothetical protein